MELITSRHHLIAAAIMHIEGFFSTQSLAYRNCNPGNLRPVGSTSTFHKFNTIQEGYDALVSDIAVNTGLPFDTFISKYAPPTENNSVLYLHLASELTGIQPTEVI